MKKYRLVVFGSILVKLEPLFYIAETGTDCNWGYFEGQGH